ncbi:hypothetical protein GGP91_003218, partial [Salinibacter ruber]
MNTTHTNGQPEPELEKRLSPDPGERLEARPIYQGTIDSDRTVVVCGAGGFIGGHLVADLLRQGFEEVRAIDIKPPNQW